MKDNFEQVYLDIIDESFHGPLKFGALMWTQNAFTKCIKDAELGKSLKKSLVGRIFIKS